MAWQSFFTVAQEITTFVVFYGSERENIVKNTKLQEQREVLYKPLAERLKQFGCVNNKSHHHGSCISHQASVASQLRTSSVIYLWQIVGYHPRVTR